MRGLHIMPRFKVRLYSRALGRVVDSSMLASDNLEFLISRIQECSLLYRIFDHKTKEYVYDNGRICDNCFLCKDRWKG